MSHFPATPLSDSALSFIASGDRPARTKSTYQTALALFERSGIALDADVLTTFRVWLKRARYRRAAGSPQLPYSAASQRLYLEALRSYLCWLDANDRLPAGVYTKAGLRLKASKSKHPPVVVHRKAAPEIGRIVTYYDEQPEPDGENDRLELARNRALMHALWSCAGRISEVLSLTRAMVCDGKAEQVQVTGKGGHLKYLLLTSQARKAIAAYCALRKDTTPALFVLHRRRRGEPMTRYAAWKVVSKAGDALGVSGIVSPHMMRHGRATELRKAGWPMEDIKDVLGHQSIRTTVDTYAEPDYEGIRERLEAM